MPFSDGFMSMGVRDIFTLLEAVALVVAAAALLTERKSHGQALRTGITVEGVRKEVSVIGEAVQTKFLNTFPDYMGDIQELFKSAKRGDIVHCVADVPGYGIFRDRDRCLDYILAIEHALNRGVVVKAVFLTASRTSALRAAQFAKAVGDWENWKATNSERLKTFVDSEPGLEMVTIDGLTSDEFLGALQNAQERILLEHFRKARVTRIDQDLSIYFWLFRDSAVFAIPSVEDEREEWGFSTRDTRLIGAMRGLADRLESHA